MITHITMWATVDDPKMIVMMTHMRCCVCVCVWGGSGGWGPKC